MQQRGHHRYPCSPRRPFVNAPRALATLLLCTRAYSASRRILLTSPFHMRSSTNLKPAAVNEGALRVFVHIVAATRLLRSLAYITRTPVSCASLLFGDASRIEVVERAGIRHVAGACFSRTSQGSGDICFSSGSDPSHSVLWTASQFWCDITADMHNCGTATPRAKHTHAVAMLRYTMGPKEAQLSLLGVCQSTPSSAAQAVGPYETFSREDQRDLFDG